MADHTLVVQAASRPSGVDLVTNKATVVLADTYYMPNDGNTRLWCKGAAVGDCVVTIDTPGAVDGNAIANPTATVVALKDRVLGPFPKSIFDQADGTVKINFATTVIDICAVRG